MANMKKGVGSVSKPASTKQVVHVCSRNWLALGILLLVSPAAAIAADRDFTVAAKLVDKSKETVSVGAAAAYDSRRGRAIVFGGADMEKRKALPSVRTLDLISLEWTTLEVTGKRPQATGMPALIYDPKRDALYLFGGWETDAEKPSAELWTLSLSGKEPLRWKLLSNGDDGAPARNGCVMVLDAARDRLLIHGGDGGPHPKYGFTPLKDLWSYDLGDARWHCLKPSGDIPEPRWNHAGAVNNETGKMFIFGGGGYVDKALVRDDCVFELDMQTLVWKKRAATGDRPAPEEGGSLTFDPVADVLVLVGGVSLADSGKPGTESIWVFDLRGDRWTEHRGELGAMRRSHTAIYDPKGRRHVITGGEEAAERGNFYAKGRSIHTIALVSVAAE